MARKARLKRKSTIDATLTKQLDEARAAEPVQAVFTLKTPAGESYRSAESAQETMRKIVDEASTHTQTQPSRVTLFPNVQSFAIAGPQALVRRVAEHAEIASAMANRQEQDLLIRPVKPSRSRKKR